MQDVVYCTCERWRKKCLKCSPRCNFLDCEFYNLDSLSASGRIEPGGLTQRTSSNLCSQQHPGSPDVDSLLRNHRPEPSRRETEATGLCIMRRRDSEERNLHRENAFDEDVTDRDDHDKETFNGIGQLVPREKVREVVRDSSFTSPPPPAAGQVWTVLPHHRLPRWMQHNEFQFTGHRPPLHSYRECFKSIFRIHSETGNIWTHMAGFVIFIIAAATFPRIGPEELEWKESVAFAIFFTGAITCFGLSTLCHTCNCHSYRVNVQVSRLDYCGITCNIVGSFVPWLYYSFYCNETVQSTYVILICSLGLVCSIVSMPETFAQGHLRQLRAGLFAALSMTSVVPALHAISANGFSHMYDIGGYRFLFVGSFFYLFGVVVYVLRVPERIFPGKFDIWFHSHQIFHVSSVIGALVYFQGMLTAESNKSLRGCTVQR